MQIKNSPSLSFTDLCEYFYGLAEKSSSVFWIKSADYEQQIYVSPAFEEIWGHSCESLYSNPELWEDHLHPADKSQMIHKVSSRKPQTDPSIKYEEIYRIIRADKTIRWIKDVSFPIYDENNIHIGFAGIAQDITEMILKNGSTDESSRLSKDSSEHENIITRLASKTNQVKHLTDLSLADLREFFYGLAEKSSSAFWIRSADYKQQIYISPAFEKIWGRNCQTLYDHPEQWDEYLYPEDREEMIQHVSLRKPQTNPTEKYETHYRIIRPDNSIRWIKDVSFPIYNEKNIHIGFAGIADDITPMKEKEDSLQAAKKQAEEANQIKSDFLMNMSHDLRGPLNGILGLAQLLDETPLQDYQKEYVRSICEAGKFQLEMIEEILCYSKFEMGKFHLRSEHFNLPQLIEEVATLTAQQVHNKNLKLIASYCHTIPTSLVGDPYSLRRILVNLIENAIKFTHQGHIAIRVEIIQHIDDTLLLEFKVHDTGIGIPEDKIHYIFGKFNRVALNYQGTGLGLSIVKQLTEALGGEIRVTSKENEGTSFQCKLPFTIQTPIASSIKNKYQNKRILVIDNYPLQGEVLLDHFTSLDNKCVSSSQAIFNLLKAQQMQKPYDIIIIDDEVNEPDYLKLAEQIKAHKDLENSFLLLASKPMKLAQVETAKSIGYSDYLIKPILPSELIENLTKTYDQHLKNLEEA